MEENNRILSIQTKSQNISTFVQAVQYHILTEQTILILLQIFKQNYLLGPVDYNQDLIELIFPFLKICEYKPSTTLQKYSKKFEFRRLLSGQVFELIQNTIEKTNHRQRSIRYTRQSIKLVQKQYSAAFIQSKDQVFASLQNPEKLYITKKLSKILVLQLNEQSKQIIKNKFDSIRPFFQKNYDFLFKNKVQGMKNIKYFQKDFKKFKDWLNVKKKVYFIEQGTIQLFDDNKDCYLQLQKGSIIGIQNFFDLDNKYSYFVKSSRLKAYYIKFQNITKLGSESLKYLQEYAHNQNKLRKQYNINKQRQPFKLNISSKMSLMKNHYEQRKKAKSEQNSSLNVLGKMYLLEQKIVMNYQVSEQFKKELPKLQKYTTLSWQSYQKTSTKKFNLFKCLQRLNRCSSELQSRRKGFDCYIKIPTASNPTTQNNSRQQSKQNTFYYKQPKSIIKKSIKTLDKVFV